MSPITDSPPAPFYPKVFISHAIGDPEWPESEVLALANAIQAKLAQEGGGARERIYLDYWHEKSRGVLSSEDWLKFMQTGVEASQVILILGSNYYFNVSSREITTRGFGVAFENVLLSHWLYNQKHKNEGRIRLVYPGKDVSDKPKNLPTNLDWVCPQYPYPKRKADLLTDLVRPRADLTLDGLGAPLPATDVPAVLTEKAALEADLKPAQRELLSLLIQPNFEPSHADKSLYLAVMELKANINWVSHALHRYAQLAWQSNGLAHQHYVNLLINAQESTADAQARAAGAVTTPLKQDAVIVNNLGDLLQLQRNARAWLVHGAPGSGKTILLQHFEMQSLRRNLVEMTQDVTPDQFCVFLACSEIPFEQPWELWLEDKLAILIASMKAGNIMGLLDKHSIQFLVDAANELPAPDLAARTHKLEELYGYFTRLPQTLAASASTLPPVFTVRSLERSAMPYSDTYTLHEAGVQPWNDTQIEDYIRKRLQGQDSDALLAALRKDPKGIGDLCRTPLLAAGQCSLYQLTKTVGRNRAELFCGLTLMRLAAKVKALTDLLSTAVCKHLESGNWKTKRTNGVLFELPDESSSKHGHLLCFIEQLAGQLRLQGGRREIDSGDAMLTELGLDHSLQKQCLDASVSLGILWPIETMDGITYKFEHELWQEFFAARYFVRHASTADAWPTALPDEHPEHSNATWTLGKRFYPNQASHSNWEETLKLAAQMCEPPKAWFAALMQNNLPLAGRLCAAAQLAGQPWAGNYKADVAKALLALQSSHAPLPLRLDAGLALGLVGDDIRYEQPWAGAPCILPKADSWIPVTAQKAYLLGTREGELDSQSDEHGAKPIRIEAFNITFAPVTNAEFVRFVDDDGYTTETWWCKEGWQWRKGMTAGYGQLQAIQKFRRDCLRLGAQPALDKFYDPQKQQPEAWAAVVAEYVTNFSDGQDAAFEAYINQKFAPSGNAFTAPFFWLDASFNQALQPVVGVCVYEAEAYVRWLNSKRQDQTYCYALPTEAQWELAARGAEKRKWPWRTQGHLAASDVPASQMNFVDTWSLATTPVGLFAQSNTPDGCVDMAGNIWEWTASQAQVNEGGALKDYEFGNPNQPVNGGAADLWRVVRGGSWSSLAQFARPAFRYRYTAGNRLYFLGFRLVSLPMPLNPDS